MTREITVRYQFNDMESLEAKALWEGVHGKLGEERSESDPLPSIEVTAVAADDLFLRQEWIEQAITEIDAEYLKEVIGDLLSMSSDKLKRVTGFDEDDEIVFSDPVDESESVAAPVKP